MYLSETEQKKFELFVVVGFHAGIICGILVVVNSGLPLGRHNERFLKFLV